MKLIQTVPIMGLRGQLAESRQKLTMRIVNYRKHRFLWHKNSNKKNGPFS
jgi:hypothetical protein